MKKRIVAILLVGTLLFSGCGTQGESSNSESKNTESENNSESTIINTDEIFSNRDFKTEYEENCAYIQLNGTSATCDENNFKITTKAD